MGGGGCLRGYCFLYLPHLKFPPNIQNTYIYLYVSNNMEKDRTIAVKPSTVERLRKHKVIPRESDNDVLWRILDKLEGIEVPIPDPSQSSLYETKDAPTPAVE